MKMIAIALIAVKILLCRGSAQEIETDSRMKLLITSLIFYFHRSSVNVVCFVPRNDYYKLIETDRFYWRNFGYYIGRN